MVNLTLSAVLVTVILASASYGLKCRSQDEKNNDEFAEIAKMCLSNVSNWDSPSMNNNRDYNNGRYNDNRHHNNRNSHDGSVDNSRDGMNNRNNRDYNTRNNNGDNDSSYGMWRKQHNSGGYGFNYGYSDSQQNPYYNPRSGIRSRGNQDRNNQRKNNNNSDNSKKNNNTNSTLELQESSPLGQVEACIVHCIFREMHMLDDSAQPDRSLVLKVMTKKIRDPEVRDFIEESVDDCFELLEMDNNRNNCEYSKNLALCLEEKGRRNCDDWEDQSDTKSNNNRNSKNPKRPN